MDRKGKWPFFIVSVFFMSLSGLADGQTGSPSSVRTVSISVDAALGQVITNFTMPFSAVNYTIAGSSAPGRFSVDANTGELSLAQSIQSDVASDYFIVVFASDSGSPSRVAYETVRVTVDRNLFDPEWTNPGSLQSFTASTSVLETIDFAFLVFSVTATDRDQSSPYNTLTYSIVGEGSASTYFNINPDNGEIRLKSSLLQDTQESYRILVKVTDRGSPPRSATATVTINVGVVRNKEGPVFINTPYTSLQNENIGVGTLITTVTARDNDPSPFNQVTYDIIGDDEAPVYFTVNRNTGAITLLRSLAGETKSTYSVRVRACDNGNPPKCNSTAVIITINRNLFTPEFTQTQYDVTIPETQNLGVPIVNLNARDQDTVTPHSQLVFRAVQDGSAALQYFQVDPNTGQISVRRSLVDDPTAATLYTMQVQVGDNGIPQRNSSTLATVRISVERNRSPPVFIGSPYNVTIREDATISSSVVQISVNDADVDNPFNNVSLSLIGDNKGPLFFTLDNNNVIRTSRDLTTDTDTSYTIRLLARDGGQPSKTATALVYVTVTRNLFSPVFQPNSYTATIPESQDLGVGFGLTMTATDNDRNSPYNSVRYEISTNAASSLGREYFLINPVSGLITVRKDLRLDTQSRTTYTFQVDAFDGEGRPAAQPASVTVTVNRNQFPPVFTNPSFLVNLNYTAVPSTQVFDADATDADTQAPYNVVTYYIIGDDDAVTYFGINQNTGVITLLQSLRNIGISQFKIRVEARDGGSPTRSAQRVVTVNVLRNFNAPVFGSAAYTATVLETIPVQSFVVQVTATDSDLEQPNNQVTYSLTNDFFLVEPASGRILLRQSLIGTNQNSISFPVTAVDGGSPQRSAQVQVTVNIQRNQFDPVFQNLPYSASKRSDAQVGESIITVFANDSDTVNPFNVVRYDIIGDDNAPNIFRIDSVNGQITMQSTFANDPSEIYRIRVRAQDGGSPPRSAVAMVTVNVRRNLFEPEFLTTNYNQRILEIADIGSTVLTVTARDSDNSAPNNALDFSLVGDARCQEYFLIDSVSGVVAVRKYLALDPTTTNPTNFQCTVSVRDRGTPSLQGRNNASLSITVVRNQPPAFINTPYSGTVVRTVSNLTRVTSYTVVDSDTDTPFNSVTVTIIGDGTAPSLFSLNGNDIIVTNPNDLAADSATTYTLRLLARDGGSTSKSATATAVITVRRNLNPPVFAEQFIVVNITVNEVVGTSLTTVLATDSDPPGPNSVVTYSEAGEGVAPDYLYVNPTTGVVRLEQSVQNYNGNSLRLLVDATDAGFPALSARATVLVNIIRDTDTLTFGFPSYNVTISENLPVNSRVIDVTAIPGPGISYRLVGYSDGPDYFDINPTTGQVFVKQNLTRDPAKKTSYELRVEASKQFTVARQTIVQPVYITVTRNENAPRFSNLVYNVTIRETHSLGNAVVQLAATDADGDTLTYSLVNSPGVTDYFYLGPASGLLSLRLPLTGVTTNRFQFQATVSDNALTNAKTGTATIIVNVLRDTQPPRFVNEPYRTVVNFNAAVGSVALPVTATDSDLVGSIVYEARGGYLAAPYFFQVDRTTGQVTLRNSVALDMTVTEYTLGVIAYDDASPGLTATSNVTITINRNPNVPVMAANQYSETVPETQQLGVTILTVSATDADQQALTYRIQSASPTGCDASYLLSPSSGTIVAIRPLQNATDDVCRMNVAATDAGTPPSTSVPVSVTISIIRNRNGPLFAGLFEISIPETTAPGTSVIQVTATDADQGYAPFRTLTYELIGDDQTPVYFSINPNTGDITLRQNLLADVTTVFNGRVRAQDGGSPPRSATATVRINILRNLNSPSFANQNYNLTILETESLTTILTTVVATDADRQGPQNTITYQMVDTSSGNLASTYFRVTTSGQIYVRSPLTGSSFSTVTFEVQAQDAGVPVRQSNPNARVTINVIRNQFPPVFQREPYNTSLPFTTGPSVSVYTVSATDADTRNPFNVVRYSLIGDDQAPAMFTIDPVSGQINTRTSLGTDILERYVLRVVAADGGTPSLTDTSTVVVTVQRNLNSPEVFPQNYTVTILEEQALGVPVVRVSASDRDVLSPYNQLIFTEDTTLTDAETQEYFGISASTGDVSVQKDLILSTRNPNTHFMLTVQVCDAGNPPRCAPQRAFVTIRVIRNRNTPYFINLPYDRSLQTLQVGSVVTTATARDDDDARYKYGQVTYSLIGDDGASAVFQIDAVTGAVRVQSSPITSGDLFRIRIQACDGGNLCNTTVAIISLRTNFLAPEFSPLPASYQRTVPETITLGEVILDLNATDRDPTAPNNALSYTITSGPEDQACFQINPFTGEISARRSLLADPCAANIFNMIVTASDGGSPSLSTTATVTVFVFRNLNSPVFQSEPYQRQLNETTAVNTTVLTVTATDADVVSPMNVVNYEIVGEGTAPNFFRINRAGQITVSSSLLSDMLTSYTLRVRAYDGGSPAKADETAVTVTVNRNLHSPVINSSSRSVSVLETQLLGDSILFMTATDGDYKAPYNQVEFELQGSDCFSVDKDTGAVFARRSLMAVPCLQETFTMNVTARDLGSPRRSSLPATVTVGVLRNRHAPVFQNATYRMIISRALRVAQPIVNVTATDADTVTPFNNVTYRLLEDSVAMLYFNIDANTGQVLLSRALTQAPGEMMVTVEARDGGMPPKLGVATVYVTMQDSVTTSPTTASPGSTTGSLVGAELGLLIGLIIVLGMLLLLIIIVIYLCVRLSRSLKDSRYLSPTTEPTAPPLPMYGQSGHFNGPMSGYRA